MFDIDYKFDYDVAFSRNIGWLTQEEQQIIRKKRVAIAGMGGVGGVHLLTLVRLGVSKFHIADMDNFDLVNINRQVGASMVSMGKSKVEVLLDLAREINPEVEIKTFASGVNEYNIELFLRDVDLYVDGLDFFAFSARQLVFNKCTLSDIPAITVAPLGMGASLINFLPGKMSFEEFFCWGANTDEEKALRFLLGLAPARLHTSYLVDKTRVNFAEKRGPSTIMACQLCAGIASTEALKILLKRGKVLSAPYGIHFDAYKNTLSKTWLPWGNKNPIQKLKLIIYRIQFKKMQKK